MNGEAELLSDVAAIVRAFEDLGVDYFVGGSVASSLFGEPRQTLDADIIARVLGRHVDPLVQKLAPEFYISAAAILTAIQRQSSFNLIHFSTATKVDVFVSWRTPFAQSQFARRQRKSIGSPEAIDLFFASPEDTILAKLRWYQDGGGISDRQWRDVIGVLKVQGERIDRAYLKDWAKELDLVDFLQRAFEDATSN